MHRRCPTARQLDAVFHLEETRTVGDDWIVRYHNRLLQLERQSAHPPARSTVTVCEWRDGRLAILYRAQPLKWHDWTPSPAEVRAPRDVVSSSSAPRQRPAPNHPWRQRVDQFRTRKTLWQALEG